MLKKLHYSQLSRRERQIMDVVLAQDEASARQVRAGMPDAPSYSAVRALLARLVEKQVLTFRQEGKQYLYRSLADPATTRRSAVRHLLDTFFHGSTGKAANALLGQHGDQLTTTELKELRQLIDTLQERQSDDAR